jgi:hypothetical protein
MNICDVYLCLDLITQALQIHLNAMLSLLFSFVFSIANLLLPHIMRKNYQFIGANTY